MRRILERCAGLDVHAKTVVACLRVHGETKEIRTFGTTTPELLALAAWLTEAGVTHVAVESTGVYWKPIFNLLESAFEVWLVNARHIKRVPGRKTDVKDCEWLAQLLEAGLVKPSFIPPAPIRELRDLTRYRKSLIEQKVAEANRVHKLLEDANVKLGQVATNVLGLSGRRMLSALIAGERDPQTLAELALGKLRKKEAALHAALTCRFTEHHAFLLGQILGHVEELERRIAELDGKIEEYLRPFAWEAIERLQTIPGVGRRVAEVLVAEIGINMDQFPLAPNLASWAGMCPGNNETAGKRKSGRTTKGSPWLRTVLIEAAWGAARSKNTYLSSLYRRIARRRGPKKAAVAVGHSILVAAWHLLKHGGTYEELGADHFDRRDTERLRRYYLRRLEDLGLRITVEDLPQAA
jgi:transposase